MPMPPQLIADDVTSEALGRLLYDHRERMAVFSAEGDLFEIMAGRYSDGSGNFAVYLKGHAGDMLKVNRVGRPAGLRAASGVDARHHGAAGGARRVGAEGRVPREGPPGPAHLLRCPRAWWAGAMRRRRRCPTLVESAISRHRRGAAGEARTDRRHPGGRRRRSRRPTRLRFSHAAEARLVAFMEALGATTRSGRRPLARARLGRQAGRSRRAGGRAAAPRRPVGDPEPESSASAETIERGDRVRRLRPRARARGLRSDGCGPRDGRRSSVVALDRRSRRAGGQAGRCVSGAPGQFPKSADLDAPFALLVEYGYLRRNRDASTAQRKGRRGPQGGHRALPTT